jgi:hypothetical protein
MEVFMRQLFVFVGILAFANNLAFSQGDARILYEAAVNKDDGALVRSGPAESYYATLKLQKGDRVKVIREDAEGWLMILPPQGSFSWVSAANFSLATDLYREYLHSKGTSQVHSNRADVYVGSDLDPESITTISAHLRKGDSVRIISTHQFNFNDGPREMMKIHPVRGEYRWIHRDAIASRDDNLSAHRSKHRSHSDSDQISEGETVPARHRHRHRHADEGSTAAVANQDDANQSSLDEGILRRSEQPRRVGGRRLSAIDHEFHDMVTQDVSTWDLDAVERQYRQLDQELGDSSVSAAIVARMDAVQRYRSYYLEYLDFVRITSETRRRDAELAAQQSFYQSGLQPSPDLTAMSGGAGVQTVAQWQNAAPMRSASQRFDGAGIVRRVADRSASGPQFALVAPDGRTLSYLQPAPGVDLNQYEGRSMGVTGSRYFRREWNADTIAVRDLQPVELRSYR